VTDKSVVPSLIQL